MHIKPELLEKYNSLKLKYPTLDNDMVMDYLEEMPEEAMLTLEEYENKKEYGCHIATEHLYNKAVSLLVGVNGAKGAKWTKDELKRISGIDFNTKEYSCYDFAYVANMLYSDYCNIFTDATYYIKMAKNYLEDSDYMGNASERAYKNAIKRIKHYKKTK